MSPMRNKRGGATNKESCQLPPAFRQLYAAPPREPAKPKQLMTTQEWQRRQQHSKHRRTNVRESIAAWLDDDEPRNNVDDILNF